MSALLDALTKGPLLGDGAMGTMLQDLGNSEGGAPELWNVEHADVVEGILEEHRGLEFVHQGRLLGRCRRRG